MGHVIRSIGARGSQHHLAGYLRGQLVLGSLVVARPSALVVQRAGRQRRRHVLRVRVAGRRVGLEQLVERTGACHLAAAPPVSGVAARRRLSRGPQRQRYQHGRHAAHAHADRPRLPPHGHLLLLSTQHDESTRWAHARPHYSSQTV